MLPHADLRSRVDEIRGWGGWTHNLEHLLPALAQWLPGPYPIHHAVGLDQAIFMYDEGLVLVQWEEQENRETSIREEWRPLSSIVSVTLEHSGQWHLNFYNGGMRDVSRYASGKRPAVGHIRFKEPLNVCADEQGRFAFPLTDEPEEMELYVSLRDKILDA